MLAYASTHPVKTGQPLYPAEALAKAGGFVETQNPNYESQTVCCLISCDLKFLMVAAAGLYATSPLALWRHPGFSLLSLPQQEHLIRVQPSKNVSKNGRQR
jgi:hypothetical protein